MTRWGDEKTLHFIHLYRNHECLWNVRSPHYVNKISRQKAYRSLLESLNDDYMNIQSLKIKIKNLRSIYHTELKKVKESRRSGGDDLLVYKPSLSWFEDMHSFLGDSAHFHGTLRSEKECQVQSTDSYQTKQESNEATLRQNLDLQSTTNNTKQACQQSRKRKFIRKIRPSDNNSVLNAIQRLENRVVTTTQQPSTLPTQDEFYYFALSVAAQLRNLPLNIAIETQSKIQNTLSEARLSSMIINTESPSSLTVYVKEETD